MQIARYLACPMLLAALGTGCAGIPKATTSTGQIVSSHGETATLTKIHLNSNIYALAAGPGAVWVGPNMEPFYGSTNVLRIDPSEYKVAATIPTNIYFFLTMASGEDSVWVPSSGSLFRIDMNRDEIVAEIPLWDYSEGIAVGEGAVWVGHDGKVSRIDINTNTVVAEIPVGRDTWERIAAGEGGVWVLKMGDSMVYRIDPLTNQVVAEISLGPPYRDSFWTILARKGVWHGLAEMGWVSHTATWIPFKGIAAGEGAVWVAKGAERAPALLRIDPRTNTVVSEIQIPGEPLSVIAHAGYVWVATRSTLVRVNPTSNKVEDVLTIPSGPECPQAYSTVTAAGDSLWYLQSTRAERPTGNACLWRVKFN